MEKKKILIVDDEPQSVEMFKIRLESAGYEVFNASSGEEGIELASKLNPDLILLDIILPDIGGFNICKAIKNNKATKDIKVVLCTNKLDEIYSIDARQSGADELIEKMIDPEIFLETIARFLK